MSPYEGAGEVVCQAESLVAAEAEGRGEVAPARCLVEAGSRTTGEGVALLCARIGGDGRAGGGRGA